MAPSTTPTDSEGCTWRQTLYVEDFPATSDARALSPNGRAHWATKSAARKEVASRVVVEATVSRLRPVRGSVRLTFRYFFPTRRQRDVDNLTTGVTKAAIDALVRGRWIEADDSETVLSVVAEAKYERGARRLEIVIAPAADGDGQVEGR
jgi:Holliday junction resolvase RusA-like endonuclease